MKSSNQIFFNKHRDLVRMINANFVIRVYILRNGKYHRTLVGAGKIDRYLTEEQALEQFEKVLSGSKSKYTWWDRNALRLEFIVK